MAATHGSYRLAHVRDQITEAFTHSIAADEVLTSKGAPAKGTAAGELAIAVRELGNALAGLTEKVEFLLTQQARRDTVEEMNKPFYAGKEYRQQQADLRRRVEELELQYHIQEGKADPQVKEPNGTELDLRRLADTLRGKRYPQDARPPERIEVIVRSARANERGEIETGTATVGLKVTVNGKQYGTFTPISINQPFDRVNDLLYVVERLCRQMRQEGLDAYQLVEGTDPRSTELT